MMAFQTSRHPSGRVVPTALITSLAARSSAPALPRTLVSPWHTLFGSRWPPCALISAIHLSRLVALVPVTTPCCSMSRRACAHLSMPSPDSIPSCSGGDWSSAFVHVIAGCWSEILPTKCAAIPSRAFPSSLRACALQSAISSHR